MSNGRNALAVDSFWINKIKEGHPDTANSAGKSTPDLVLTGLSAKFLGLLFSSVCDILALGRTSPVRVSDTILNAGQGPAAENPAVDAILGIQKNRSLANRLADQLILNNDESTRTKPAEEAETKAVETLLQPAKERETAWKRLADTLEQQIIVNKDGWTQARIWRRRGGFEGGDGTRTPEASVTVSEDRY